MKQERKVRAGTDKKDCVRELINLMPPRRSPKQIKEVQSMSKNELDRAALDLLAVRAMIEELQAEAEALTDKIKGAIVDQGTEVLEGDGWRASWKNVNSSRFDSKAFKAAHGDLYTEYTKPVTTCRFLISA